MTAVLSLSSSAAAQLVAPNATGVAMGHVHVFARGDVAAMRQFLRLLGGEPTQTGRCRNRPISRRVCEPRIPRHEHRWECGLGGEPLWLPT